MRELNVSEVTQAVRELCIEANKHLPEDLAQRIAACAGCENGDLPAGIMQDLLENLEAARELDIPICQDTGMAVVFAEIGQEVHFTGGIFEQAVEEGVRRGYTEGLLRCSVVGDPLERVNTGDNTPPVLHTRIVPGDRVSLTVAPKGFGSENMSRLQMLTPAAGRDGVVEFVVDTVRRAGGNPCPPMVVGVGIGGDFESCALLAKRALCRPVDERNANPFYAQLEAELLERINHLNIGPQGFGGKTTALAVNVEAGATHIAGLPVAVNIGCHVTRHLKKIL
ncbi:MAG TPA: fumarate hydratase [Candidatus Fimivicinus intestinavium]|nr:fumarate hydratase [Candidatus Fimivicinus intestinavium]